MESCGAKGPVLQTGPRYKNSYPCGSLGYVPQALRADMAMRRSYHRLWLADPAFAGSVSPYHPMSFTTT
jgi:hypothetical protein